MNMKQNAALEMFEYLKEHLIPLAKDKGDKVYESDTTVQIARPENKSVWDCEKEVKQLLSKIGAYSASVKNSINCVIINYSQTPPVGSRGNPSNPKQEGTDAVYIPDTAKWMKK